MEGKSKLQLGDILHHNIHGHNNMFRVVSIDYYENEITLDWFQQNGEPYDEVVILAEDAIFTVFKMHVVDRKVKEIEDD